MISRSAHRRGRRERMGEGKFRGFQNILKAERHGLRVLPQLHQVEQSLFRGATVRVEPDTKRWVSLRAIRHSLSEQMSRISGRIQRRTSRTGFTQATA